MHCLTTDTREANDLGSTKFKSEADSNSKKICSYNRNKKEERKQTFTGDKTIFSIVKIIDNKYKRRYLYRH